MRLKERFIMFLLVLMFFGAGGMFYYENVMLQENEMKDKQYVVVAIKDIPKGATFKEGENYGVITLDKKYIFDDHIVYDVNEGHKKILEGKKANSSILKNELLLKKRISDEVAKENTFRLFVKPHTKTDVEKGDLINVYVQFNEPDAKDSKKIYYHQYLLMENVVVENIITKKDSRGNDMGVMEYIEVTASEKDSLNYQLAEYLKKKNQSEILVYEAKDILKDAVTEYPRFEEAKVYKVTNESYQKENANTVVAEEKKEDVKE